MANDLLGYAEVKNIMTLVSKLSKEDRDSFWNDPSKVSNGSAPAVPTNFNLDQIAMIKAARQDLEDTLAGHDPVYKDQWVEGSATTLATCRPAYTPPTLFVRVKPAGSVVPNDYMARMIFWYDKLTDQHSLEAALVNQYKKSPVGVYKDDAARALKALRLPFPPN